MEIKKLIEKKGRYNKSEKQWLTEQGEKVGVKAPTDEACPDCWRDMALHIAYELDLLNPKKKAHRLRGNAARDGVVFRGVLITNENIEELWDWMQANGFPQQLLENEN